MDEVGTLHPGYEIFHSLSGHGQTFGYSPNSNICRTANRSQLHRHFIESGLTTELFGPIECCQRFSVLITIDVEEGEGAEMLAFEKAVAGLCEDLETLLEQSFRLVKTTPAG
jgi:hypothetical protein